MRKIIRGGIVSLLMIAMVFQFFVFPGSVCAKTGASDSAAGKVRVGYTNNNFHYRNLDGTYGGYGYEYLQELAKYTGWDYEYVKGTLEQCHERLKNGEIDILGAAQWTSEREKSMEYPKLSSGISYVVLCVKDSNKDIAYDDYDSFNGKTVGLLEGSNNNIYFEEFCREKDITVNRIVYESQEQVSQALYQDKVQMILTNSLIKEYNEKTVAQFAPIEFYFVTSKGSYKILTELNDAQEQIKIINPYYDAMLYEKYYGSRASKYFVLSREDKQHVEQMNSVRVAVLSDRAPIQGFDKEKNVFSGVTIDLLEIMTNMTGLQFNYIPAENYDAALKLLREKKADMVCGLPEDSSMAAAQQISLTSPYLKSQTVLVKNRNVKNFNKVTVAAIKGEAVPPELKNPDIVYYNTLKECVSAVNKGEADICYGNIYLIEKIIQDPRMNGIALSTVVNLKSNLCFGFARPVDKQLVSLFNKALNYISDNEVQEIIYNNTLEKEYKMSLLSILYSRPDIFAVLILSVSLMILMIVIYAFYNKMNNQKILARAALIQEERYRVATEIANDILFEYDIETDTMKNAEKFTEVFGRDPVLPAFIERMDEIQNVQMEDWTVYEEFCMSLKSGIDMVEGEYRILDKDGDYVWCHIRGKTIFNKNNEAVKVIGKIVNIDIQKKELEKLLFKAQRDPLTNLYNKAITKELIDRTLYHTDEITSHALIIMDIDNFKGINDSFGHLLGDKVLTKVVGQMRKIFEGHDILGRIGGDEFVAFIYDIKSKEEAAEKARLLGASMSEICFEEVESLTVTVSIGIACYPENGREYDKLVANADKALYFVKNKGKNNFDFYSERMED